MEHVLRLVGGWALIAIGMAILPLPVPSSPFLLGGLALLAPDYPWARRWMEKIRGLFARRKAANKVDAAGRVVAL